MRATNVRFEPLQSRSRRATKDYNPSRSRRATNDYEWPRQRHNWPFKLPSDPKHTHVPCLNMPLFRVWGLPERAVVVPGTDIAGVQPSVLVNGVGSLFGILKVSLQKSQCRV